MTDPKPQLLPPVHRKNWSGWQDQRPQTPAQVLACLRELVATHKLSWVAHGCLSVNDTRATEQVKQLGLYVSRLTRYSKAYLGEGDIAILVGAEAAATLMAQAKEHTTQRGR